MSWDSVVLRVTDRVFVRFMGTIVLAAALYAGLTDDRRQWMNVCEASANRSLCVAAYLKREPTMSGMWMYGDRKLSNEIRSAENRISDMKTTVGQEAFAYRSTAAE